MEAELPLIEKMLQETTMRSVFGERLEDHLRATNRTIAFPIALSIRYIERTGSHLDSRQQCYPVAPWTWQRFHFGSRNILL